MHYGMSKKRNEHTGLQQYETTTKKNGTRKT